MLSLLWLTGYESGIAAAQCSAQAQYSRIQTSGMLSETVHLALYACVLPPTERLAGAGRAQLRVVWSGEILLL